MHNASPVGLVLMLYDQLVKDLRQAGIAMRENRPEACATELKHGFLIIQQLEGSLKRDTGEEFVTWLIRFYSLLRTNIIEAQVKRSPELLAEQIAMILNVRSAWQEVELRNTSASPSSLSTAPTRNASNEDGVRTNWSA